MHIQHNQAKQVAPLQIIVLGFSNPKYEGDILDEINRLRQNKNIKIIDVLAAAKNEDDEIVAISDSSLYAGSSNTNGALIGWLIGLDPADNEITAESALKKALAAECEYESGIDQELVKQIVNSIPPGGAAAIIMVEHSWLLPLKRSVQKAKGVVIAQDFINAEVLGEIRNRVYHTVTH